MAVGRLQIESPRGSHALAPTPEQSTLPLSDLLRRASLPLNTRCGQRGLCDGCLIELVSGELVHLRTGQTVHANGSAVLLRGCEHRLSPTAGATVRVPERSALGYEPRIVTEFRLNVTCSHAPLYQQIELTQAQDICQAIARLRPGLPVQITESAQAQAQALASAPFVFCGIEHRGDHRLVTAVTAQRDAAMLGAAVDIGTTTVVVFLIDLTNGQVIGSAASFNEQMHLGDDVLTRIQLCTSDPTMLNQLHAALVERTIRPLLHDALRQAEAPLENLKCICFAGNTTMLHLLARVDPSSMGFAPFTPTFINHRIMAGTEVFRDGPPVTATCHLLPGAAAYVGADLTAGAIASGLIYDPGPSLLVDVGTNGEIILKHGDKLIGCATAAGPAFEGAGLSSGMRAGEGAISHFKIEEDLTVHTEVIGEGGVRPVGVCGSAYIDFLAEGRRAGLLTPAGRFDRQGPEPLVRRIAELPSRDLAFTLNHAMGRQPITITQLDVARLLQAKAAIAAGILTLLDRFGMQPAQVKTVYLAGGFGTHMDASHAIAAGLLPGFEPSQIQAVGNTSLGGAFLALMDAGVLDEIARIGKRMEIIELNLEPQFESHYIDQLSLPEPTIS